MAEAGARSDTLKEDEKKTLLLRRGHLELHNLGNRTLRPWPPLLRSHRTGDTARHLPTEVWWELAA